MTADDYLYDQDWSSGRWIRTPLDRVAWLYRQLRWYLWHFLFVFHMLAAALRWWRKPCRQPGSDDPRDDMSLRTALEVAYICWK